MSDQYYEALEMCYQRYYNMLDDMRYWDGGPEVEKLANFLQEFRAGIKKHLPLNKLNRWLGYIQGTLITMEETTVEAERNWTRPLFRLLDFPEE